MIVFRYFFRLLTWLFLEWIGSVAGIILVLLGALPSGSELPEVLGFAQKWLHSDWSRWAIIVLGFVFVLASIYNNLFSPNQLKARLRASLEDLSSSSIEIRLHAISEILEISRSSRKLHPGCMRILTNYLQVRYPAEVPNRTMTVIRRRFGRPGIRMEEQRGNDPHAFAQEELNLPRRPTNVDAQAAIEAIAQRRRFFDDPRQWLDLSCVDLQSVDLEGYHIGRISFAGANLRHGHFDRCDLRDACFDGAIVSEASFREAKLDDASFQFARGQRAYFDKASLRRAKFFGADLYDAYIQSADARQADFHAANLWRLDVGLTDFTSADFSNADLRSVHMHHAKGLSKEQIFGRHGSGATIDKNTTFPWSTPDELRAAGIH